MLIRLLVPYHIETKWSIYTYPKHFVEEVSKNRTDHLKEVWEKSDGTLSADFYGSTLRTNNFLEASFSNTENFYTIIYFILFAGIILFATYFTISYFLCIYRFRHAYIVTELFIEQWKKEHPLRRKFQICCSDQIKVPLTFGIVKPVILLPKEMLNCEKEEIFFIIQHEYIHIRRLDGMLKLLLTAAVCIHWFNPLVWLMQRLCERDLEYACDEEVVEGKGKKEKKAYAMTLLHIEEKKKIHCTYGVGFTAGDTERRLKKIKDIKNRTARGCFLGAVVSCAITVLLAIVFSTSPIGWSQPKKIKFEVEEKELPIEVIDKAYEAIREHWGNRNYYLIKESILYYAEKQTWAVLLKLYDGQYIYSVNYVTGESKKSAPCVIYQEKAEQGGIGSCWYFNPEKNFEALECIIADAKDSYFVDYCGINEENGKKYYIYTSIIEGIDKEMKTERMYWEPVAGAINILY